MEKFTAEEAKFLLELLNQVQVPATAPDAVKAVQIVQSAARKIGLLTEKGEGEK